MNGHGDHHAGQPGDPTQVTTDLYFGDITNVEESNKILIIERWNGYRIETHHADPLEHIDLVHQDSELVDKIEVLHWDNETITLRVWESYYQKGMPYAYEYKTPHFLRISELLKNKL